MNPLVTAIGLITASVFFQPRADAAISLSAGEPLALAGAAAKFDFMAADSANDRILAAHKQAGTLTVYDLKSGKPTEVSVGHAQGVAVDDKSGTYFIGTDDEHKVVFLKASTLEKTGEVTVPGPVDAVEFDPKNGLVYADEDDGKRVWVIDPRAKKLVETITIPGAPEVLAYDLDTNRIYQNIKDKDEVVVINPDTNRIEATWSTLPLTGPHGLVIDRANHLALVAGHNGKVVALDLSTGKAAFNVDTGLGSDQIAFDDEKKVLYCASKGAISVVEVGPSGFSPAKNVPDPAGAHTIAVDRKRHDVWVSYANKEKSYLQKFGVSP